MDKLHMHTHTHSLHLQHVPVDQVLFLRTRVRARSMTGKSMAILISSEAGMARFWDILGPQDPLGGQQKLMQQRTDLTSQWDSIHQVEL